MNPSELFILPEALPVLLLVPFLWILLRRLDRDGEKRLLSLIGPVVKRLAPELHLRERRLGRWLAAAAFLLAVVALLQPVAGSGGPTMELRGGDVLVCLDVSRSMLAGDTAPSRLERAKQEISLMADHLRGGRLGLVAFAGEAELISPLTGDMDSYLSLLEKTDPLSVRLGGTDLGVALETALRFLDDASWSTKTVLLITDGEDLEGRGQLAAEKCREQGVTVHCVGIGSEAGSKIVIDSEGEESFLLDRTGIEVVTSLRSQSLGRLAATTGGLYREAGARSTPIVDLYEEEIVPKAQSTFESEERRRQGNRYQWPLLVAFLLWLMELGLTDRMKR